MEDIYTNISESTLALLGLQEISYDLAKHAYEKRKKQAVDTLKRNANFHKDYQLDHLKKDFANTASNAMKEKGFSGKVNSIKHGIKNLFSIKKQGKRLIDAEEKAHENGIGVIDAAKTGMKAWSLNNAIKRKQERVPDWSKKK